MKLDLAKRLVNARTEKNLTQEKLSELSGVSVSEISRIEKRKIFRNCRNSLQTFQCS